MFSLVNFQQQILDEFSPAYRIYLELIDNDLVSYPTIFTDKNAALQNKNIPVFDTFYMRHQFHDFNILTDLQDFKFIQSYLQPKTIVVYNELTTKQEDLPKNAFATITTNVTVIDFKNLLSKLSQENYV